MAALIAIGIGVALVIVPTLADKPSRERLTKDPFADSRSITKKVIKVDKDGKKSTETTTSSETIPLWERTVSFGGFFFLRLGLVALIAFLAGAATQKILVGDYALKVGSLEVPALTAESSQEAITGLTADLAAQKLIIQQTAGLTATLAVQVASLAELLQD